MSDSNELLNQATRLVDAGEVDSLRDLLSAHADLVHSRRSDDATLLIHLIDWPGHHPNAAETARVLLEAGADVDARRNDQNGTSLAGALCTEEPEVIRVLLEFGADIHAPLGWMEGTVLEFADHLCENATTSARPSIEAIGTIFSSAVGRRVPKRPKFGGVTPLLFVSDFDQALDYYCERLGFRLDWEDDSEEATADGDRYLCISRGGAEFHMTLCKCPDGRHLGTLFARIPVEDVDRLADELRGAEIEFKREPKNEPWGLREFEIVDADGNRLIFFSQHVGRQSDDGHDEKSSE